MTGRKSAANRVLSEFSSKTIDDLKSHLRADIRGFVERQMRLLAHSRLALLSPVGSNGWSMEYFHDGRPRTVELRSKRRTDAGGNDQLAFSGLPDGIEAIALLHGEFTSPPVQEFRRELSRGSADQSNNPDSAMLPQELGGIDLAAKGDEDSVETLREDIAFEDEELSLAADGGDEEEWEDAFPEGSNEDSAAAKSEEEVSNWLVEWVGDGLEYEYYDSELDTELDLFVRLSYRYVDRDGQSHACGETGSDSTAEHHHRARLIRMAYDEEAGCWKATWPITCSNNKELDTDSIYLTLRSATTSDVVQFEPEHKNRNEVSQVSRFLADRKCKAYPKAVGEIARGEAVFAEVPVHQSGECYLLRFVENSSEAEAPHDESSPFCLDEADVERLINQYGDDLLKTAFRKLGDNEFAEDAVQSTFFAAAKNSQLKFLLINKERHRKNEEEIRKLLFAILRFNTWDFLKLKLKKVFRQAPETGVPSESQDILVSQEVRFGREDYTDNAQRWAKLADFEEQIKRFLNDFELQIASLAGSAEAIADELTENGTPTTKYQVDRARKNIRKKSEVLRAFNHLTEQDETHALFSLLEIQILRELKFFGTKATDLDSLFEDGHFDEIAGGEDLHTLPQWQKFRQHAMVKLDRELVILSLAQALKMHEDDVRFLEDCYVRGNSTEQLADEFEMTVAAMETRIEKWRLRLHAQYIIDVDGAQLSASKSGSSSRKYSRQIYVYARHLLNHWIVEHKTIDLAKEKVVARYVSNNPEKLVPKNDDGESACPVKTSAIRVVDQAHELALKMWASTSHFFQDVVPPLPSAS